MRRFDGLIFDLGSTLIYFDGDWVEVYTRANEKLLRVLQAAGLELEDQVFLEEFHSRLQEYYAERETEFIEYTTAYILCTLLADLGYPEVPDSLIRSALRDMYSVSQAYWRPEADAIPTLQRLSKLGYRMAIVSNAGDDADVQALVDKAKIRSYFDTVLTSAAAGIRKPNPRIFDMVLEEWGLSPERVAMIGDTLGADILGARNADLFSILITLRADVPANRAHADTIQPDAVISSLSELDGLLEKLG